MKIEIGGGTIPALGFINLDPHHGEGNWQRIIQDGIPAKDDSVDAVRASHVMEHIPAGQVRIDVMNEVWRVLKPNGTFEIIVPFFTGSWHAIADPTHVSFWVTESFHYFDGLFAANAEYGIKLWDTKELYIEQGFEGHWLGVPRK
jgi:ubiquinone/menaquinone biosynthesis C-methylase UbiE